MFRPQAGMTDPYINETVTYVAELDEEAIRKEIWQPFLCFFIFNLILGIIVPLFCIIPWIMFCCVMNHANSTAEGTQVYITENTLVYVEGDQFSRVTVPLTSIATVMVQPPDLLINIKPTAPKEVLSRPGYSGSLLTDETFVTRSVPIPNVKNAEAFAEVIREMITS